MTMRAGLKFLVGLFAAEKAPYMVAAFMAAAAWTVVRTTDRLAGLPLVEYQVQSEDHAQGQRSVVRLRNLAQSTFPCFQLTVAAVSSSPLRFEISKPHAVTILGGVRSGVSRIALEPELVVFSITDFAPSADIEVAIFSQGSGEPKLLASVCAGASQATPRLPQLAKRSIESLLVEHELVVLWGGLLVWLLLVVGMLGAQKSTPLWRD